MLALFGVYLTSDVLVFKKELDDVEFRSSAVNQYVSTTSVPSIRDLPPSKDKCEPLYILIYIHCFVWFLFLVIYVP